MAGMNKRVNVGGVDVEIESRYRVEMNLWQASLRHPRHGFTVMEWGATPQKASRAAYWALLFYAREMERIILESPTSP